MTAVEYALVALLAGSVAVQAMAAREVARLAKAAEMIYAALSTPTQQQPPPAAAEAAQLAAAEAAQGQPQQADECVVDLVRRYGCLPLADVKLKCDASVRELARMRKEGKIMITRDNRVCPKPS